MFCRNCGNNCADTAQFCPKCGTTLVSPIQPEAQVNYAPPYTPQTVPPYVPPYTAAPVATEAPSAHGGFIQKLRSVTGSGLVITTCILAFVYLLFNLISNCISVSDCEDAISIINMIIMLVTLGMASVSILLMFIKSKSSSGYNIGAPLTIGKITAFIMLGYTSVVILLTFIAACGAARDEISSSFFYRGIDDLFFYRIFMYFASPLGEMDATFQDAEIILAIGSVIAMAMYVMYYLSLIKVLMGLSSSVRTGSFNAGKWAVMFMIFACIINAFALIGNIIKVSSSAYIAAFTSEEGVILTFISSIAGFVFNILLGINFLKLKSLYAPKAPTYPMYR